MDTELREPKQVTATAEEERNPVFSPEGDAILFVSDRRRPSRHLAGETCEATRNSGGRTRNSSVERLTTDAEDESQLKFSPDGSKLAFVKGRGDLWVMDPEGKGAKTC